MPACPPSTPRHNPSIAAHEPHSKNSDALDLKARSSSHRHAFTGPEYYGLAYPEVKRLIQGLPGAKNCATTPMGHGCYKWQDFGDAPPASAAAPASTTFTVCPMLPTCGLAPISLHMFWCSSGFAHRSCRVIDAAPVFVSRCRETVRITPSASVTHVRCMLDAVGVWCLCRSSRSAMWAAARRRGTRRSRHGRH